MSKAQTLIEQFYQEEIERQAQEATFTPLDLSVSSADMAIINTISKRFNKDKNILVREALSQALLDMFSALEPVERKMLAKESDELAKSIATEIAEEQGLESLEVSGTNWVQQDKNCVKEERRIEKELEKQQKQAAKSVLGEQSESKPETNSDLPEAAELEQSDSEDQTSIEQLEAIEDTQENTSNSIFG